MSSNGSHEPKPSEFVLIRFHYARPYYLPPHGTPLNWRYEVSGQLINAVLAYWQGRPLERDELTLLKQWAEYYINAPCWENNADEETRSRLQGLRSQIKAVETLSDLRLWCESCMNVGLDPF